MIDLLRSTSACPATHAVPTDPGRSWARDAAVAIDAPPDGQTDPRAEATWAVDATRSGICGAVSPRVVALPGGGYRLYYTQILARPGFPAGANDYDNSTARILSAKSTDGLAWTPEPGVRLSARQGGAGDFRVASSDVAPLAGNAHGGRLRMYYECSPGPQTQPNSIRSALSDDGGLTWMPEPGERLAAGQANYSAPRIVFLDRGHCRLYCSERGKGIISALSEDGGLMFHQESGVRVAQGGTYDAVAAFAPDIMRVDGAGYLMYYAGYGAPNRAYILRAISEDGLTWRKEPQPVVSPGQGRWDAAKCSEVCLYRLAPKAGEPPRYRMVYEACDGTAKGERGVWRIASAETP